MKKIAMVKNGVVENIATWDGISEWGPSGYELIDVTNIFCDIGYLYVNGEFIPPQTEGE